jgi:hypothetical protein
LFLYGNNIHAVQLELFEWEPLTEAEKEQIYGEIRREYWFIRYHRGSYNPSAKRRHYRRIAKQKRRLLLAGVSKREVLDFISGCR